MRLTLLACLAVALGATGCENRWNQAQDAPMATAVPAPVRPVGPVPGPGAPPEHEDNPWAGDAQAQRAGRQLFVAMNCYGCHGGRGGGGMGPSLRDPDWIYGHHPSDLFGSISEGRAHGMPAWGTRLNRQQIWQLVAYLQSMGTADEPEAPR